jgi:ribosomal protein S18 acetylase RimI-like enzyme
MRIRSASLADAAALTRLWQESGLRFRAGDVPAELAAVLARDGDLVLVAEDADGLAAAVLGTFDGRRGWVNRLATGPGHRGQGHATAILAELERRLAAKACRKVNLLIEPGNQAVSSFYRLRGYAEDELIFMEKWLLQRGLFKRPPRYAKFTSVAECRCNKDDLFVKGFSYHTTS